MQPILPVNAIEPSKRSDTSKPRSVQWKPSRLDRICTRLTSIRASRADCIARKFHPTVRRSLPSASTNSDSLSTTGGSACYPRSCILSTISIDRFAGDFPTFLSRLVDASSAILPRPPLSPSVMGNQHSLTVEQVQEMKLQSECQHTAAHHSLTHSLAHTATDRFVAPIRHSHDHPALFLSSAHNHLIPSRTYLSNAAPSHCHFHSPLPSHRPAQSPTTS